MQRNLLNVYDAWYKHKECKKYKAIWTDGLSIYSYDTVLLFVEGKVWKLNTTKYSQTTTKKQNQLRQLLQSDNIYFLETSL